MQLAFEHTCRSTVPPTQGVQTRVATDADDHAANLTGWNQLYDQLTPGRFTGKVDELWLGQLQLFEETTSHAMQQSCEVWPGSWWFGVPVSREVQGKIGPHSIADASIAVRPGGTQFELLTPPGFRILGLVVKQDELLEHMQSTEGAQLPQFLRQRELLEIGPEQKRILIREFQQILSADPAALEHPQARRMLREALLCALTAACCDLTATQEEVLTHLGRHSLVRRVREYGMAHCEDPITIPELCRVFRVSRRTLQYSFQDVVGISPGAYLRIQRLNGVRRALRDAAANSASSPGTPLEVQDAAAGWGFWHLSQFACDYKKLFGERPSETLRRRA